MNVTGTTQLYFLLADPIDQVRAPEVFNHVFDRHGIDAAAAYDGLMKNQPTSFLRAVRARGLVGEPGFDMQIQQTSLYLDFFGHTDATASVPRVASAIRRLLYPCKHAA